MIRARLAWLQDDPARALTRLRAALTPAEQQDYAALRLPERQRGFLLSRALLRQTLHRTTGLAPAAATFTRAGSGRLVLASPAGWHISLSHARGLVAVLVAEAPCGIDIEPPRAVDGARVAARYFHAAEQAWLASLPAAEAAAAFFRLWTLKEAAAKAAGQGLAHNMERLAFDLAGPAPTGFGSAAGLQAWQEQAAEAWLAAVVATPAAVDWQCRAAGLDEL